MKNNNLEFIEKEIDIKDLFNSILKNKILIVCVLFIVTLFFYFKPHEQKSLSHEVSALIQKPPQHIFLNFINSNQIFFRNIYGQEDTISIAKNELQTFYDLFILKILSSDEFDLFIKSKDKKLYNEILNEKKNNIYKKIIRIIDANNLNSAEDFSSRLTEKIILKLNSTYDGKQILSDFINYAYDETNKDYVKLKKKEFNEILERHEKALIVSNNLKIENPFFINPGTSSNGTQGVSLTGHYNVYPPLYFKGTKILNNEIEFLKNKIQKENLDLLLFEPIIDGPYYTYQKNKNVDSLKMTNLVKGLIYGIFIAFILIYFKSLIINKNSIKKKRR